MTELEQQHARWRRANQRLYGTPDNIVRIPLRPPKRTVADIAAAIKAASFKPLKYTMAYSDMIAPEYLLAKQRLREMAPGRARRIICQVAGDAGLTHAILVSARRDDAAVNARRKAIIRIHEELHLSCPAIGRIFNRDHTTILHALGTTTNAKKLAAKRAAKG